MNEFDESTTLRDPPVAGFLFQSTGWPTIVWLVVRVLVGGQWLIEGWQGLKSINSGTPLETVTAMGQTTVGLALVLGAFVGIAATAGVVTNVSALLAGGATQPDPLQVGAAILLILAWKNAGYIGLDRYILKRFGAPWWETQVPHVPGAYRRNSAGAQPN